jgi:hypothetical protein
MATVFMSRPKSAALADPREALSLERLAPEYLAKVAQLDALTTRRAEEVARAAELVRAIPAAEAALSDLEIAMADEKAIAQARKTLERLRQDEEDCRRREGAFARALEAMQAELEPLRAAAIERLGAAGRALHEQAGQRKARAFGEAVAADEYEQSVRRELEGALRAFRPGTVAGYSRASVLAGRFIQSLEAPWLRENVSTWLRDAAKNGYPVDD